MGGLPHVPALVPAFCAEARQSVPALGGEHEAIRPSCSLFQSRGGRDSFLFPPSPFRAVPFLGRTLTSRKVFDIVFDIK
jgi:hypothetical protein